jgi:hypothetical protein
VISVSEMAGHLFSLPREVTSGDITLLWHTALAVHR